MHHTVTKNKKCNIQPDLQSRKISAGGDFSEKKPFFAPFLVISAH